MIQYNADQKESSLHCSHLVVKACRYFCSNPELAREEGVSPRVMVIQVITSTDLHNASSLCTYGVRDILRMIDAEWNELLPFVPGQSVASIQEAIARTDCKIVWIREKESSKKPQPTNL